MPVTEFYAFNLICENLLAALYGVALNSILAVFLFSNENIIRIFFKFSYFPR